MSLSVFSSLLVLLGFRENHFKPECERGDHKSRRFGVLDVFCPPLSLEAFNLDQQTGSVISGFFEDAQSFKELIIKFSSTPLSVNVFNRKTDS